jgi:hypothetical protein
MNDTISFFRSRGKNGREKWKRRWEQKERLRGGPKAGAVGEREKKKMKGESGKVRSGTKIEGRNHKTFDAYVLL